MSFGVFRGHLAAATLSQVSADDQRPLPPAEVVRRLRRSHANERSRLARVLHDQVAHALGVVLNSLELHEQYLRSDPQRARAQFRSAVRATRRCLETVRALCTDLRLREIDDGLEDALSTYLRAVAPPDIGWTVTVVGDDARIPGEMRDELYLTLREAARNSLIHSSAHRVEIDVRIGPDAVRATAHDDGRGFDVAEHEHAEGLASMRERAYLLGGSFDLSSAPGAGTTVRVRIPLGDTTDERGD